MNDIRTVLKVAASRLYATAYIAQLHRIAIVVLGMALLAILVDKSTPAVTVPWLWTGPALTVVGLAAAFGLWWRRRQDEIQIALAVDDRLELREKLSTALHVRHRDDAFARAAIEDAVTTARDARTREAVRRQFRVEPPNRWWASPLLLALAVAAGLLIPQGDLFARELPENTVVAAPEVVRQSFEATIEKIKESEELADELDDVLKELDPSKLDPESLKTPEGAKREAIKKLSDLNERIEEMMDEKGKTAEALKKSLEQLKSPSKDGPAKELSKALAEGNFDDAKKALQELQEQAEAGELSDAQKKALSDQLEDLSQQLAQMSKDKKALEDALQQAGLDKKLANNPQALQQALQQNQNLTQQQKQQLQQMAQAQANANQMCQGMAGAMQQMAQGMGGQPGQMNQGAGKMGQMLSDAENLAQMLKQARAMSNTLKGQCQGLGQGLGQNQGLAMRGRGAFGGPGQGQGGEAPRAKTPTGGQLTKVDSQDGSADIIANTLFEGPLIKGESNARFKEVARSAADSLAQTVNDDQIPRKYHDAMKHYTGELQTKSRDTGGESGSGESGGASEEGGSGDS